jgi:arginase
VGTLWWRPAQDAERIEEVMSSGVVSRSAITRCAVALATQPVVLRCRPDAVVVWLDAHGDINVPADTRSGYLGGMAFSGPMGWWDSGLGAGLPATQAVLVGARHLDPTEETHVAAAAITLVENGEGSCEVGSRLRSSAARSTCTETATFCNRA